MDIRKRSFMVTGGSSGLGAACVRMLVENEARVVIADVNREAGGQLADEFGDAAIYCDTDVTDEGSVARAVQTAIEKWGALHGSIQCAGIALAKKLLGKSEPHPLAEFTKVIQVNLIGTFNVNRLAAAAMCRNEPNDEGERGVIINTASVAAFEGQIGQVAYSASKGGVVAMTLPLARELARHGVRVNTIAPGIFDTPLMAGLPEPARRSLAEQIPFPSRLGRPSEYAHLVQHLIENPMLNGEVIRLDGALRMGPK